MLAWNEVATDHLEFNMDIISSTRQGYIANTSQHSIDSASSRDSEDPVAT